MKLPIRSLSLLVTISSRGRINGKNALFPLVERSSLSHRRRQLAADLAVDAVLA